MCLYPNLNEKSKRFFTNEDLKHFALGLLHERQNMDIQTIATEYSRLLGKRFIIGLENGEVMELSFPRDAFYHLLGFEKFEDVSIVRMIEAKAYDKDSFFRSVASGKITFERTSINISEKNKQRYSEKGVWKEFKDARKTQQTEDVLNGRFPYFTYDNILKLLCEEVVALYDASIAPSWRKLEADKIIFREVHPENRNLNLFTRKERGGNKDKPVSFFLEKIKDEYLKTKPGTPEKTQKIIKILFRAEYNTTKLEKMTIFWDKVRFYYSKNAFPEYEAQRRIQEYLERGTVVSPQIIQDFIEKKRQLKKETCEELSKIEHELEIIEKIIQWDKETDNDRKDLLAIELLEKKYINVELEDYATRIENKEKLHQKIKEIKSRLKIINKQISKFEKYNSVSKVLEIKEIKYIYGFFSPEICGMEDSFIETIRDQIIEDGLLPKDLENQYKEYRLSMR